MGESPTRFQRLAVMPPVEVPAAMLPRRSSATTPTVPYWCVSVLSKAALGLAGGAGAPSGRGGMGEPSFSSWRTRSCQRRSVKKKAGGTRSGGPRAGERDGMTLALPIGNRAGPHRLPIHDRRIELVGAIRRKNRATTGVEERIIFEELDGGFDSIERRATLIEHVGSGGERLLDSSAIVSLGFGGHRGARNDSGAAVKHQSPLVLCGSGLRGGCGSTLCPR